MSGGVRRCGTATLLALSLLSAAGCAGTPRAFQADDRLMITAPSPLSIVSPPFIVSWQTTGRSDAAYAVFVDSAPVAPGHGMRDLADNQCRRIQGCPDLTYLAGRGVYLTRSHQVDVPTLPLLAGVSGRATHPAHSVTVIVLDDHGLRKGDVAWEVEFRV